MKLDKINKIPIPENLKKQISADVALLTDLENLAALVPDNKVVLPDNKSKSSHVLSTVIWTCNPEFTSLVDKLRKDNAARDAIKG